MRGKVDKSTESAESKLKIKYNRAPVAESVDASDLKSDWANNSVPVQVWPGAILRQGESLVFCCCKLFFVECKLPTSLRKISKGF